MNELGRPRNSAASLPPCELQARRPLPRIEAPVPSPILGRKEAAGPNFGKAGSSRTDPQLIQQATIRIACTGKTRLGSNTWTEVSRMKRPWMIRFKGISGNALRDNLTRHTLAVSIFQVN